MTVIAAFPILTGSCSCGLEVAQRLDATTDDCLTCPQCDGIIANTHRTNAEFIPTA